MSRRKAAQQQLRHTTRTTLGYVHLRGDTAEQAIEAVADSLELDQRSSTEWKLDAMNFLSGRSCAIGLTDSDSTSTNTAFFAKVIWAD